MNLPQSPKEMKMIEESLEEAKLSIINMINRKLKAKLIVTECYPYIQEGADEGEYLFGYIIKGYEKRQGGAFKLLMLMIDYDLYPYKIWLKRNGRTIFCKGSDLVEIKYLHPLTGLTGLTALTEKNPNLTLLSALSTLSGGVDILFPLNQNPCKKIATSLKNSPQIYNHSL